MAGSLGERLAHARGRLANAESIGRHAHIARCRQRVEGLEAKISAKTVSVETGYSWVDRIPFDKITDYRAPNRQTGGQ